MLLLNLNNNFNDKTYVFDDYVVYQIQQSLAKPIDEYPFLDMEIFEDPFLGF